MYINVFSAFFLVCHLCICIMCETDLDATLPVRIKKNGRDFILGKKAMYKFDQLMCGLQQCERECVLRPMCMMIGYDMNSLTCSLSNYTDTEDDPGNKQVFVSDPLYWTPPTELSRTCSGHCLSGYKCFLYDAGRKSKCLITECTTVEIKEAAISPESNLRAVGSSVNVSCKTGFEGRGPSNSVTCHADGSYKSTEFSCGSPCLQPMTIINGECKGQFTGITSANGAIRKCVEINSRLLQITADKLQNLENTLDKGAKVILDGRKGATSWSWSSGVGSTESESLDYLIGLNLKGPCIYYKVGDGFKSCGCTFNVNGYYICENP